MAFYKGKGLGAVTVDTSLPWYDQILTVGDQIVQDATAKPTASVNALTSEVATTRQTVIVAAVAVAALLLLRGGSRR